jgi:phosphate uptake regulator
LFCPIFGQSLAILYSNNELEKVGDIAANIAEDVIYLVDAEIVPYTRGVRGLTTTRFNACR